MAPGDIAALIFAAGFVLFVLFLGVPLVKLGRVLEEASVSVKLLNRELEPILSETKVTLEETNKQLKRFDNITRDVEQVTENISSLVAVITAGIGGPAIRVVAALRGVAKIFSGRAGK